MTPITKYACAFILAGGLASPALAAQGDAGAGPTTGATTTNDAGSGPTKGAATDSQTPMQHGQMNTDANSAAANSGSMQKGQTNANANSAMAGGSNMHVAQKLRSDLGKAGYTNITIMPSSFIVRAKNSEGSPVMMVISPEFGDGADRGDAAPQLRQQFEAHGRKRQQRRSDTRTELHRRLPTHHARRRRQAVTVDAVETGQVRKGVHRDGPLSDLGPSRAARDDARPATAPGRELLWEREIASSNSWLRSARPRTMADAWIGFDTLSRRRPP